MQNRKRRATSQLTPENLDEPEHTEEQLITPKPRKQIQKSGELINALKGKILFPDLIKNMDRRLEAEKVELKNHADVDSKKQVHIDSGKSSKISALNRSFLKVIKTITEKESCKDLRYLFSQYEEHMNNISKK